MSGVMGEAEWARLRYNPLYTDGSTDEGLQPRLTFKTSRDASLSAVPSQFKNSTQSKQAVVPHPPVALRLVENKEENELSFFCLF